MLTAIASPLVTSTNDLMISDTSTRTEIEVSFDKMLSKLFADCAAAEKDALAKGKEMEAIGYQLVEDANAAEASAMSGSRTISNALVRSGTNLPETQQSPAFTEHADPVRDKAASESPNQSMTNLADTLKASSVYQTNSQVALLSEALFKADF